MSRIQDILAKAERDGTARRTHAMPSTAPTAPIDGALAMNTTAFSAAAIAPPPPAAPMVASMTVRSAEAMLHPTLVAAIAPHSVVAEQYRAIRSRLTQREESGPLRTLAVTSALPGDGRSLTAANLALTMAQEFQRSIVLVDGDMRNPAVHALFGVDRTPGLREVLAGEVTLDEALIYLPELRLTILPAGAPADYPTELLGSAAMRRSMDALRARFDRVVLDVPAAAPLADFGTVAPLLDGAIVVVRAGATERPALEQALAGIDAQKLVGLVLNDAH